MKSMMTMTIALSLLMAAGCDELQNRKTDTERTKDIALRLEQRQPTPTDINYSLERFNLMRRAYWVNGMRERAVTLPCPVDRPLGYIVLVTESGAVLGRFVVDGKVSSLNSFLSPDSEYYGQDGGNYGSKNRWLSDVDGSYGNNDTGIFFFTPDGRYVEWTGTYLYSDIPFDVKEPVLMIGGAQ